MNYIFLNPLGRDVSNSRKRRDKILGCKNYLYVTTMNEWKDNQLTK